MIPSILMDSLHPKYLIWLTRIPANQPAHVFSSATFPVFILGKGAIFPALIPLIISQKITPTILQSHPHALSCYDVEILQNLHKLRPIRSVNEFNVHWNGPQHSDRPKRESAAVWTAKTDGSYASKVCPLRTMMCIHSEGDKRIEWVTVFVWGIQILFLILLWYTNNKRSLACWVYSMPVK